MCYMEPNCVSINVRLAQGGKYKCELNNATVDESKLTFLQETDAYYLAIENPCSSSPCLNNGTCQVGFTSKGFRCVCVHGFVGENCSVVFRPKSCSDLKRVYPNTKSGPCTIYPDGEGGSQPYNVTCNMTDKNEIGVTVVSHDSENRTLVNGYEEKGSYSRDIHYQGATVSQLVGLINVSKHCEQFIKYECLASTLNDGFWVSRHSVEMTYWGGATPDPDSPMKCACGMNNTCAIKDEVCNCVANENNWLEDSGLLTEKTHLPVKQLRFGDTGGDTEQGYHTLGKLKCYGIV
ncbi:neurexin-4-like [Pocillopora verrucosa]|uniref:neurexin-4-like n=1 Tax=Pocillopora verrucosa TaxID=203993 RepID=UPI00333F0583